MSAAGAGRDAQLCAAAGRCADSQAAGTAGWQVMFPAEPDSATLLVLFPQNCRSYTRAYLA